MEDLLKIIRQFPEKRIVVIGDVMLDRYLEGEVSRISPEAPVPVLLVLDESNIPGGAANVASNICTLGGKVSLFGFAADDEPSKILGRIFNAQGIKYFLDPCSKTSLKIRPKCKNYQLARIDYEDTSEKKFLEETIEKMKQEIDDSDIVIISDYAKGAITSDLMQSLSCYKNKMIVDPKPKNTKLYHNVLLVKTNEKESHEILAVEDICKRGNELRKIFESDIIITRGSKGMYIFSDQEMEIPTYAHEVYDVTGAGDTVISALALSIASQASLEQAAIIANHAAGIAVSKAGTYQVKLNELEKRMVGKESKIKKLDELLDISTDLRKKGKRIIWTNGCFDILHQGHVRYLTKAKEQGDCLIVGLNSDESVRALKGPKRPVMHEESRAEVISSLACVDYVLVFPETSVEKYLLNLKPDIYVKGGDYTLDKMNQNEREALESYGARIVFIPVEKDMSTSSIIEKIQNGGRE